MKRVAMIMVILVLLVAAITGASAEQSPWYEQSVNDTVLTVRLDGTNWEWEISNPAALELITQETNGSLAASFMSTAYMDSSASLILRRVENAAAPALETRVLDLSISKSNVITINSVLEARRTDDWYELDSENGVLTVRLPGGDWKFGSLDEDVVELITVESNEDAFVASFRAPMVKFGTTQLNFSIGNDMHTRSIDVFVSENGEMFLQRSEIFDVLEPVESEPTIEFIPVEPVVEDPQPVEFKTVNVTGGTVNLRSAATTDSDTIAKLKKGDNARYLGQTVADDSGMEWHKISFGGNTGWISAKYARIGGEGYVRIVNGSCNMRSMPNLDGEVISVIQKDVTVKYLGQGVTDTRGVDWYKVSVNGKEGWVSSKYAVFTAAPAPANNGSSGKSSKTKTEYKYVKISGGKCNMRKSANKDSERVTILQNGTVANYLGEQQTDSRGVVWYKASYNKKTGWVSSKYAKLTNENSGNNGGGSNKKTDSSDMRLVLNPNRYDVLQVHDIYSQDGRTVYVVGNFGTVKSGEPSHFDSRKNVTMKMVLGADVMLPSDPSSDSGITAVSSPEVWFNNARNASGGSYMFYATFSMNESGDLRSLVYKPVY